MTSRERIENVLSGKPVDRHPVVPLFMRYAAKIAGIPFSKYCTDYRALVEADLRTYEMFRYDMVSVISDAFREASDIGEHVEFPHDGVPYCLDYLLKEYDDLKKVRFADPLQSERMLDRIKAVELFRKELGGEVPVLGWVEGALAEACDLRSVQKTLMDSIDNPEFLHELLERVTEIEIRFAEEQVKAGADWIGIGEAVGSLVSQDTYRQFAFPYTKRIADAVHSAGAKVRLHICGDISHQFPVLREMGADIIDLDWMVSFAKARKELGPGACLAGNFDPAGILEKGTAREVRSKIEEAAREAAPNYMVCPGCEVTPDTPMDNMMAFCPGPSNGMN